MSSHGGWPELLDALEERLRRVELLATGHDVDVPEVALEIAAPIPPELAARAMALLNRSVEVEAMARSRMDREVRASLTYSRR